MKRCPIQGILKSSFDFFCYFAWRIFRTVNLTYLVRKIRDSIHSCNMKSNQQLHKIIKNCKLPVRTVIPEVRKKLAADNTLILTAPPGAGKSTLLPLALLDEPWLKGQKIIMLEPRRLAARMIAARMAELLGEKVGETVGYRIRLDKKVSAKTRIEIVTEGILTRMLQHDNELKGVGMVIFDEFHERSIHADVALAFFRESQQILRPDLRMLIMSATIDTARLAKKLGAATVTGTGRQFPVDIRYAGEADVFLLPELTARLVARVVKEHEGDVLVFLPGEGEIRKCADLLQKHLPTFAIHPLYSRLKPSEQAAAIFPDKSGRRKIVLATSIAETSLTIEGIKVVVDSGFGRTMKYDPSSGLSRLETIQIAQDSADQRAGRAGRLSAGVCYRMWTQATHSRRQEHRNPEILVADLAPLALEMANWGITDPTQLEWVTPPPSGALAGASELLVQLGAIKDHKITAHGKKMHNLPCHPRIAHMLLKAEEMDLLTLATDLAAILEERDPLTASEAGIDINLRIEALRRYRRSKAGSRRFRQIEMIAESYRKMFGTKPDDESVNPYETGLLLVFVYPERIASARPGNNAQFRLSNGRLAMASHADDLAHEPWLAVAHMDARDNIGKIFLASPLNPKDLAPLVEARETICWDTAAGGLQAVTEMRIGNIILEQKPLHTFDQAAARDAIIKAVRREGAQLLSFTDKVEQLQNRLSSLRLWRPEEGWPDFLTKALLLSPAAWLGPYLDDVKKNEDLEKLDLYEILFYHMDLKLQQKLDKLAPVRMKVPSGSMIRLKYFPDGSPPVMAVRLQEVFGMTSTPRINEDNTPVLMHLLSPGFKVVQITGDLESFWNEAYFEVKKEMKRRYPKHYWPENPLEAEAVKGVRKRRR